MLSFCSRAAWGGGGEWKIFGSGVGGFLVLVTVNWIGWLLQA